MEFIYGLGYHEILSATQISVSVYVPRPIKNIFFSKKNAIKKIFFSKKNRQKYFHFI